MGGSLANVANQPRPHLGDERSRTRSIEEPDRHRYSTPCTHQGKDFGHHFSYVRTLHVHFQREEPGGGLRHGSPDVKVECRSHSIGIRTAPGFASCRSQFGSGKGRRLTHRFGGGGSDSFDRDSNRTLLRRVPASYGATSSRASEVHSQVRIPITPMKKARAHGGLFHWSQLQDSNLRPADYESAALPTELSWRSAFSLPWEGPGINY